MNDQNDAYSGLMEDLKALNDLKEAAVSPAFGQRWRAALPDQTKKSFPVMRYALAAAAVLVYLLGGTALWRAFHLPNRTDTVTPLTQPMIQMMSPSEEIAEEWSEDTAEAEAADDTVFESSGAANGRMAPLGTSAPALSGSAAAQRGAEAAFSPETDLPKDEGPTFMQSMREYLAFTLPWAAGAAAAAGAVWLLVRKKHSPRP